MSGGFVVETVVSQMFGENAYIVYREGEHQCAVVDPGFDADEIVARMAQLEVELAVILNTHGHADHIAGNAVLKQQWPDVPLIIGTNDAPKLTDPHANLSAQLGGAVISPTADRLVAQGDTVDMGGWVIKVLDAPGHSEGHVVYLVDDPPNVSLFSGDVLFQGSIGRTDFPDGDMATLVRSIHDTLFALPDDTVVYSGHGGPTTIGVEKQCNPFVGIGRG